MISCKTATFLVSKQEEHKLSIRESVQLAIHMKACSLCRLFKLQTDWLCRQMKDAVLNDEQQLSRERKDHLKKILQSGND